MSPSHTARKEMANPAWLWGSCSRVPIVLAGPALMSPTQPSAGGRRTLTLGFEGEEMISR